MTGFRAADATTVLRSFQRDTVDHVVEQFYGPPQNDRFLVADETGLGKSLVARGVVAHAIEKLLDDDGIDRIDIIYVCSSVDLARQNLRRLDVLGQLDNKTFATDRLTMLALSGYELKQPSGGLGKTVNLIAFTPGTSFDHGGSLGQAPERALIAVMLRDWYVLSTADWRRLRLVLRGYALKGFDSKIASTDARIERIGELDPDIVERFIGAAEQQGLIDELWALLDGIGRRRSLDDVEFDQARELVGKFRRILASAGVEALEPDLIILDEFQRFRDLLDRDASPAAELAHELFEYKDAKVLLLSATPFKPFTFAEEDDDGDDHYQDLVRTLRFIADGGAGGVDEITADLSDFRRLVLAEGDVSEVRNRLSDSLRRLMCRTERPRTDNNDMVQEFVHTVDDVHAGDLVEYVRLRELSTELDAPFNIEYWKSAPYFANFMDGYKIGQVTKDRLRDPLDDGRLHDFLAETTHLTSDEVARGGEVVRGNGRMRELNDQTVASDWWRLPWLPASLTYTEPGGPWSDPALAHVTKRLIFSSWSATPTAVATMLSHEANRLMTHGRVVRPRLQFPTTGTTAMNTLAVFWPHPELALQTDPLGAIRAHSGTMDVQRLRDIAAVALGDFVLNQDVGASTIQEWAAVFGNTAFPLELSVDAMVAAIEGASDAVASGDENAGLKMHVEHARTWSQDHVKLKPDHARSAEHAAAFGLFGPGNIAYRSLNRVLGSADTVTPTGLWTAAAIISAGFRTLFNRPDIQSLIDSEYGTTDPYWQRVLAVTADGNLQAVLDEYLHHVRNNEYSGPLGDDTLTQLAMTAQQAMSLRPATYQLFDPSNPSEPIRMPARFAIRYGSKNERRQDNDAVRLPEVREAFNSPFWPYVLATTSVGQEGIDFHWWCHAVVHWNTPASPVDFEQREGRVHRYGGHAVRRNVADAHGTAALASQEPHPWDALWKLATDLRASHGELSPHWVYPGNHKIQRHVLPYALSSDNARLTRLKSDVAMYRLAFGQPRQEDLIAILESKGLAANSDALANYRIELRPSGRRLESSA